MDEIEKTDLITVTRPRGGRPKGSKNKETPASVARKFGPLARVNVQKALEQGNLKVSMQVMRYCYGSKAPSPITIDVKKIKSPEDGKRAMEQVLDAAMQGQINLDDAEKYFNLISQYLDLTKLQEMEETLEKLTELLEHKLG